MDDVLSIYSLPDEIIAMVLRFNDINEILNFSRTCKRFNELIKNNQSFWKEKFKTLLPVIYKTAEKHCNGLWFHEYQSYMRQKQLIYEELLKMSPKHYWRKEEVTMHDIRNFYTIASKHGLSFYYTIYILQDLLVKVNEKTSQFDTKKPFTLTEMFYAKTVLRHLIHCYLCVKWVKHRSQHTLPPENVANFFLQWIDTHNLHYMEDVDEKLQEMTDMVKAHLSKTYPQQLKSNVIYTPEQVLSSVSHIFFQENRFTLNSTANLDCLDIIKICDSKVGNRIVVYAMYQAVARRAGVSCELIAFGNHVFLEWRHSPDRRDYKVNITTGKIESKRLCPFAQSDMNPQYRYSPDALLESLHSAYIKCMGFSKRWTVVNSTDLLSFLGGNYGHSSPYDNFYAYLYENVDLMKTDLNLDIKYLTPKEIRIIISMHNFQAQAPNAVPRSGENALRILEVKKHHASVLYAVGMVCCHKSYDYVCVVRDWTCSYQETWRTCFAEDHLEDGLNQPFYRVMAADHSERYVAQENLIPLADPIRLKDIEGFLGQDFTHFDGFCYVLNEEKVREYPDEKVIIDVFKQRFGKFE